MPRALKDFRYHDFERNESVQVRAGDQVDPAVVGPHVDLAKLGRTRYLDLETDEGAVRPREVVKPKRGRPPKAPA